MLAVILIALVVYLASTLIKKDTGTKHITKLIRETLPYSGLNEVLYKEFLANINMAIEYKSHTEVSEKLLNSCTRKLTRTRIIYRFYRYKCYRRVRHVSEQYKR